MANDIADWSSSVVVQSGSVSISGTATVTISGTPQVSFAPGQSVSIAGTATVTISGTPSVTISGTPTVILGSGTASIGSISAIGSTVTVAGTINIGNTPAVTISGTPTVNIGAGSVSITGQPVVNIQSANGVAIAGPNLLAPYASGPIKSGWYNSGNAGGPTFNADGTLTMTAGVTGSGGFAMVTPQFNVATGLDRSIAVKPGETYLVQAYVKALTHDDTMLIQLLTCDLSGTASFQGTSLRSTPVGSWVLISASFVVPPNNYQACLRLVSGPCTVGDQYQVGWASLSNVGAFPMNAQQGTLQVGHPWVEVLSGQTGGTGSGSFTTSAVESDAQQLMLVIAGPTSSDGYFGLSVKGLQTGNYYLPQTNSSQAVVGMVTVPINGSADSTFLISFTSATTASTILLLAFESSIPPGYPGLGQQQGAASLPVVIASDQTPITVHPWIYSQFQHSVAGSGVQATVTFAAFAGRQWVATALVASMTAIAAASVQTDVRVKDGTTDIWVVGLGFGSGNGFTDRWSSERLALNGTTNTSMTFEFIAGIVNVVERINAGLYAVAP